MKIIKRLLAVLFCAALLASISATAFAEEYTYTVRFFSGAHGTFDGREVLVYDNLNYGDRVTFDLGSVTLDDNSKYYVKGIRESGKDNDTIGNTSFTVTKDQDYVVAYGMISNAVAYTVVHLDLQGNNIAPTENYYGNVGDKPVVSYQYIGGFRPDYYNITGTLSDNEEDNVYEFVYYHTDGSDNPSDTGGNGSGSNNSGGNSSGGSSSGDNSSGRSSSGGTGTGRTGTGGSSGGSQGGTGGSSGGSQGGSQGGTGGGTTTPEEQNTPEAPEGTQAGETEQPGETTEPEDTHGENENPPQNGETQEIKDNDNPTGTEDGDGGEQTTDDKQEQEDTSRRSFFDNPILIGILFSVLAIIIAAIILFILLRRRNDQ